jgi:hypothetical protein
MMAQRPDATVTMLPSHGQRQQPLGNSPEDVVIDPRSDDLPLRVPVRLKVSSCWAGGRISLNARGSTTNAMSELIAIQ